MARKTSGAGWTRVRQGVAAARAAAAGQARRRHWRASAAVVLVAGALLARTPATRAYPVSPTPSPTTASCAAPTDTATAAPTATDTAVPSGGGGPAPAPTAVRQLAGSAPGTPANPLGFIAANVSTALGGSQVAASQASLPWATGGDVVAGDAGFSIPPEPGIPGNIAVAIQAQPAGALVAPGGPAQFSPNGTLIQVKMTDDQGQRVTTFAAPITLTVKYNAADVGQAGGQASHLTLAYVIDAHTPAIMNPNHLPLGTFVIAPPSNVRLDAAGGTLAFSTQGVSGVFAVMTNPVGYVQTLTPDAPELSSFDPATSQVFGTRPQFSFLRVVEPQIGGRLLVQDPASGNYAYVNAADVGPSGAPPGLALRGEVATPAHGFALQDPGCGPTSTPTLMPTNTPTNTPTATSTPTVTPTATPAGPNVTTLAGNGTAGFMDGSGGANGAAEFHGPYGVAVDSSGNVYVVDYYNNRVRKIDSGGAVTTLAGNGTSGFADGAGGTAEFSGPSGVAVDSAGNVYVADYYNKRVRKIDSGGAVTTLAGNGTAGFVDGSGGANGSAEFRGPYGVAVDSSGNVYLADASNNRIRKIDHATGAVTTLAGNGTPGFVDGAGGTAEFRNPIGVAVDSAGNVYVADFSNQRIRKIDHATGNVTTLAGNGTSGFVDGAGGTAEFNYPVGVAVDSSGNVYVADRSNNRVRKIDSGGNVTTLAGDGTGAWADGLGGVNGAAEFDNPYGVAVDGSGNVYVADDGNNRIRKIS